MRDTSKSEFNSLALRAALRYAVRQGYTMGGALHPRWRIATVLVTQSHERRSQRNDIVIMLAARNKVWQVRMALECLLFDTQLAKLIWGIDLVKSELFSHVQQKGEDDYTAYYTTRPAFEVCLREMTIRTDRLAYFVESLPPHIVETKKEV